MFKKIEKESFYYGSTVVLMTTKDVQSKADNITVISSTWTLDKTIVVGLGLDNKGFLNLKVGSEATFNVANGNIWEKSNVSQKQLETQKFLLTREKQVINIVQINSV